MARNDNDRILVNSSEYYKPLRRNRKVRVIEHHETPVLFHPTVGARRTVPSESYIWKYGDSYWSLASQYYGDPSVWWVIGGFNKKPSETMLKIGDEIKIPLSLSQALQVL